MKKPNDEDMRTIYNSLMGYHSTIVSARFEVAGLYMAASAFLIQAISKDGELPSGAIAMLGLVFTIAIWILDIRNYALLENLGGQGEVIEGKLNLNEELGFFRFMKNQPIGPRRPFIPRWRKKYIPSYNGKKKYLVRYIFSHSFGLSLIYVSGGLIWLYLLIKPFLACIIPVTLKYLTS